MDDQTIDDQQDARTDRRARLYRTRAIVLRRQDLGEADRILTLLTAEHGKRRVVAKGARRTASKIAGHLEPFSAARLLLARTRGLDIVSQAESIEPFPHLRTREIAIATAGYLAELVDRLLPDEEPHEDSWELLFASLRLLDEGRDPTIVARVFELGLVGQLGYRPELYRCLACGRELEPVVNGFSVEGGVVCADCLRYRPDAAEISANALKLLRAIDRGEIERLFGLRAPAGLWQEVDQVLARYLTRLTGRESNARRVLSELRLE